MAGCPDNKRGDLLELTWVTIAASLAMGLGAAFLFVFAVKRDWFRNIEDAKYQVFWSDRDGSNVSSDVVTGLRPDTTWGSQRGDAEGAKRPGGPPSFMSGEAADGSESEKK